MRIKTPIFLFAMAFLIASKKAPTETSCIDSRMYDNMQDSLPPLHSINDADIMEVKSSFEEQTITVTLNDHHVYVYKRPDWDYEDYLPATSNKVKVAIKGIKMTFTKCEKPPNFPGGDSAWDSYMNEFLKTHEKEIKKAGSGEVSLQFIVHIHGQLTDISIASNTGSSKLSDLATEAIKNSGPWNCGKQNGRDIIAYAKTIIKFPK